MRKRAFRSLAVLAVGGAFLLGDCDPTVQATVENGIINTSTAALSSVFQALLNIFSDAVNQDTQAMIQIPGLLG
jgi:hypothetical protein